MSALGWIVAGLAGVAVGGVILWPHGASASSSPPGCPPLGNLPTLKLGSTGEAVSTWQRILGTVPVTGVFDAATDAATAAWQTSHGLAGDRVVGPKTWGAAGCVAAVKQAQATAHADAPVVPEPAHVDTGDSGRTWALSLPDQNHNSPARQAAILAAVTAGFYVAPELASVTYERDGHQVTIRTHVDALAIGHADPVRVDVSHRTAQVIADRLGMILPTTRMADAAYLSASRVSPQALGASNDMDSVPKMIKHSDAVTSARGGRPGLLRDNGKDWVTTERLFGSPVPTHSSVGGGGGDVPAGANFGWHADFGTLRSPGGLAVLQSVGLAHDMNYSDYSQVLTLYAADCTIDGASRSVVEVLEDPGLAYLLSDEVTRGTACKVTRHPAVPLGG